MEFAVLGSLAVTEGGRTLTPSAPKVRQVLSLLLLRHNQLISTEDFINELWGYNPPSSAHSTLQTYIYKLRKLLVGNDVPGEDDLLLTRKHGYEIAIEPETLDLYQFEQSMARGVALLSTELAAGTAVLSDALSLWHGPVLADVDTGDLLAVYVTALEEKRLRSLELRLDADLQLGRHREVIGELRKLISDRPLHEEFHTRLMLALHRSGRRSEALQAYGHMRDVLLTELGIDPSPESQRLHQALLASDPSLDIAPRHAAIPLRQTTLPPPAHLPPDLADFTGREAELEQTSRWLVQSDDFGLGVVSITGMPGAGKSAFTVHAAHQLREHFPDGQFFVDLKAAQQEPAHPSAVLHRMLRAVGVPEDEIPHSLEERSNLFRTWSSDRRVLMVLDDTASAAQVRPLLPSSPRSAVLISSRTAQHSLPGVRLLDLDVLPHEDGLELLAKIIGRHRVEQESLSAATIVRQCGCLPLAIRAAAARLVAARGWPLSTLATRLARWRTRLDELCSPGFDLQASFDVEYDALSSDDRAALHALSLFGTKQFSSADAARLLDSDMETVDTVLARLVEHHFLRFTEGGRVGDVLFAFHELTRIHARKHLDAELHHQDDRSAEFAVRIDEIDLDAHVPAQAARDHADSRSLEVRELITRSRQARQAG
ncbi:AfsR/SARP family transcriptional regulator [Amycolatopsis rubida]|uniref:DNA-binding transcriptional activator of the SARP family n=1 Tax=Amycolatopsis rubida TaxID=112413 RepID=A0A1I5TJH2_9PSEU|nr:AfsR/SARP family transcriptional regulator [Amycolatopsis rubida]SFP83021.1 DNA-binding transcriptional activator of the SARP family [Amycolatopsis rubida]